MTVTGPGIFDNDEAQSFIDQLQAEADDVSILEESVRQINQVPPAEVPNAIDSSRALAAAEIISAAGGNPGPFLPTEAKAWVHKHMLQVPVTLRDQALDAVQRIRENSGLREFWQKRSDYTEWVNEVLGLEERLRRASV